MRFPGEFFIIKSVYCGAPRALRIERGEAHETGKLQNRRGNAVVLVLGAKVFENRLSTTLQNRVQAAADYLRAHPEAVCITTGGQGRDEPRAEGDAAKQALEAFGIAPERITAEDALAHDAREPALFEGDS